jgi:hypothetical protein
MPRINTTIALIGIDNGKNSFHVVGLDRRGAIVLRQKWSRSQVGNGPIRRGRRTISVTRKPLPWRCSAQPWPTQTMTFTTRK